MELIDGVFHQLSKDTSLVAITADYPGLLPASKVIKTEVPVFSFLSCMPCTNNVSQGKSLRQKADPTVGSQQGPLKPGRPKRSADQIEILAQRYGVQI